jgi:hypothetical protein
MALRLRKIYVVICCVLAISAYGQEIPLSAKVHEQTDTIVNGRLVATLTRNTIFHRSSDGSTLTLPDARGADTAGTMWDNRTGVAYRLDLTNRIAHEDKNSPHAPNPARHSQFDRRFAEDAVEGNKCTVVPLTVNATDKYAGFSPIPGKTCVSTELGLELRSDVVVETASGKTERHTRELHDIRVNVEPDPSLFDLHDYTVR